VVEEEEVAEVEVTLNTIVAEVGCTWVDDGIAIMTTIMITDLTLPHLSILLLVILIPLCSSLVATAAAVVLALHPDVTMNPTIVETLLMENAIVEKVVASLTLAKFVVIFYGVVATVRIVGFPMTKVKESYVVTSKKECVIVEIHVASFIQ